MSVELPSPSVIARTDDWVLQEGRYGPRMVLTARWSEVAARAWASRGARELEERLFGATVACEEP